MIKNYFIIAIRQLYKNKTFSSINVIGLAIGMAAFILLMLFVQNEVSYDQYHSKRDRIYSLWNKSYWGEELKCWDVTPKVAAVTLRQDFPEIEKVVRVDWPQNRLMKFGDKKLFSNGCVVDPDFFSVFDFTLIEGSVNSIFTNPNSIIITPELSEKLFGKENPVGKTIKLENSENLTVTGIIESPPNNTRFKFEYLIPWKFIEKDGPETNWGNNSTRTYVLVKENASIASLQVKMKTLRKTYSNVKDFYEMFLYPMERWRLHSTFENGIESGGKIETIKLLVIIAAFILVVACINFMNLSTARSEKRAKEVGIRKTVGASRGSVMKQFFIETIVISFLSFIIAILLVQLFLPAYNLLIDKKLEVNYLDPLFWFWSVTFVLFTGLLAGSYPAVYLSAFKPIVVLKGTFKKVEKSINLRKTLVVVQFVFAISLIISTIVVKQQIEHVVNRNAGYEKNNLVFHYMSDDLTKNYEQLKAELLQNRLIESITKTSNPVTEGWSNSWGFNWEGKNPDDKTIFDRLCVDDGIVKTAKFQLIQGRDFNLKEFITDSSAVIINEAALKTIRFKDPIGKTIYDGEEPYHIIGVIKNFILNSPYEEVEPMMVLGARNLFFNVINIRLNYTSNLQKIEAMFKKYNPEYPVNIQFTDKEYALKFEEMQRIGTLASLFAILTVFISCLGLFGLASYTAETKTKEIGVRKVLGASILNITVMLSSNFIKLVIIALIIASPITFWLMSQWLKGYNYHVEIKWWVFILASLLSIMISIITVVYQAIKAATANPVKSLRTE